MLLNFHFKTIDRGWRVSVIFELIVQKSTLMVDPHSNRLSTPYFFYELDFCASTHFWGTFLFVEALCFTRRKALIFLQIKIYYADGLGQEIMSKWSWCSQEIKGMWESCDEAKIWRSYCSASIWKSFNSRLYRLSCHRYMKLSLEYFFFPSFLHLLEQFNYYYQLYSILVESWTPPLISILQYDFFVIVDSHCMLWFTF